jgi:TonB-linked SusC/RagA family outer membrane protein
MGNKTKFNFLKLLLILALFPSLAFSQNIEITGSVRGGDLNGETLIGASIIAKSAGKTVTAVTDLSGEFKIVADRNSELKVSYVGYEDFKTMVKGRTKLDIVLKSANGNLDEVVVVGYGVMRKSDLTGSVGKVNVNDLKKVSTLDAVQAMEGRMAGVNVISNSGAPGAGATVRIRGIGTINNSDPLYIVDGFPVSDISHIAPTDIESMEVLKDASATAIYGSRGANGVVLVKTKTGAKGAKMELQANVYFGISKIAKTIEMADATQFAHAWREVQSGSSDDEFAASHPLVQYILDSEKAGNYLKGTDWQKEITRTAISQRYSATVQGSGDLYSYNHGVTYSNEDGIIKGSKLEKFMFHSNNNFTLSKHVKIGLNMDYVWYRKPGSQESDFYGGAIPGALRSDPISAAWDTYTNFYGQVYYSPSQKNPALSIWQNGYNKTSENRFIGNFFLQIDDLFIKGLSFRAQFGKTYMFSDNKNFSPIYYITATQKNDEQTLYQSRNTVNNWSTTNYFSYNGAVSKMNINATLGMEMQANESSDIWAKGYDVPEDADLQYLGAHKDAVKFDLGGGKGQSRLESGFFRTNLSWDNRYLFTGTIRVDGTSRFMQEKRWGWFPSFSAGWNISNEKFMQPLTNLIPVLKLRAGWGLVGNQSSAGEFDYVSSVVSGYNYALNGLPVAGAVQQQLANTELTWESAEQYNVGVDYGFFNNKLNGSIDFFVRKTKDMILSRPIPTYAGKKRPSVNAGTMENKGIEFSINYQDRIGDFNYSLGFNTTWIKNKVTSLAGGDPIRSGGVGRMGNTTMTEEGREIAYFYGYKTDGIFKTQADLDAYVNSAGAQIVGLGGVRPELGDVKYLDRDDDGKITEADMTYLGSGSPDFTGGININLGYKNFDLTVFMNYSLGNEIVNSMYQALYSSRMFETNVSRDMAVNHWSVDNPNGNCPRFTKADPNKNDETFSDRMVENGSYLRVKQVQLGYTLPKTLTMKAGIKSLRIYATVDNLCTLTKYSGLDPEIFGLYGSPLYYGVDMCNYPQPRTYSFGLNVTF